MSREPWPKIEVELSNLRRLLTEHRGLVESARLNGPTTWERTALGALLHGFYNGIENGFKRIAVELDRELQTGTDWHRP